VRLQFLQNDSLGVGSSLEGGGLPDGTEAAATVGFVGPASETAVSAQFARGMKSTGLALAYMLMDGWEGEGVPIVSQVLLGSTPATQL
jgi:hypothetical protein